MKRLKTPLIILVIIVALVLIKLKFFGSASVVQGPVTNAPAPATLVTVYVAVAAELNSNVYVTGSVIANEEAVLMPEVSGKLISLSINEGSEVQKGQLLAKINDADLQAQLKKIGFQVKLAQDKTDREKQLLAINGLSKEEYETVESQLNSLKADLDFTKAQIEKTEIRAPFNGTIGLRTVSEGSFVTPATRIAAIQQLNPVKIDFAVPERYAAALNKNDVIHFTINENTESFSAKVYAIEPKIDANTRSIQLRALAENSKHSLFAGAFAKIELPLKKIDKAILIPTEAVIPVLKGKMVYICKDGKAKQVPVESGIRTDTSVQIISGLQAGDSVITTGIMQLKPGSSVRVAGARKK